jgi:hypothetical protein
MGQSSEAFIFKDIARVCRLELLHFRAGLTSPLSAGKGLSGGIRTVYLRHTVSSAAVLAPSNLGCSVVFWLQ